MTQLENSLRRLLDAAAPEPPAGSGPPVIAPTPPPRRSYAPLLAAATVVVLVAAVLVGRVVWPGPHMRQTTSETPATAAPGMQVVSYSGISIQVPVAWRIETSACSYPRANSVLSATGEAFSCPMLSEPPQPDPRFTTVSLGSGALVDLAAPTPIMIDGVHAVRAIAPSRGPTVGTVVVASRNVAITVNAPTERQVRSVLDTVRITPVDIRGCVDRAAPMSATTNSPATSLVPGVPVSVVACQYDLTNRAYRLVGSRTLDATQSRRLERLLRSGSEGTGKPVAAYSNSIVRYRFTYADGTTRLVDATLDVDPPTVSDGHRTAVPVHADLPRAVP